MPPDPHRTTPIWEYGPVKEVELKERSRSQHYDEYRMEVKTKDALFQGVARTLLPHLT